MPYAHTINAHDYHFETLRTLLAKASPQRSGDQLAGVAAANAQERVAAQMALAEVPLRQFLSEAVVPYEDDEVTRLILDSHDAQAFAPVSHLTVGDFRNWLLGDAADSAALARLAPGLTPEMVAAVRPGADRPQMPGGDPLSQHHWLGRSHGHATSAQSPHG